MTTKYSGLTFQGYISLPCTFGICHVQSPGIDRGISKRFENQKVKKESKKETEDLTYFQPRIEPQPTQNMSTTVCNPVINIRFSSSPTVTLTLRCIIEIKMLVEGLMSMTISCMQQFKGTYELSNLIPMWVSSTRIQKQNTMDEAQTADTSIIFLFYRSCFYDRQ